MDIENLIKVLFLVLVFGGWIVKAIFQNLLKPGRRPAQGGQEGGPPAKGLREFLEEIRQEEARGGAPARQAEPEEELVWEEVEDAEELEEVAEPPRPVARQGQRTAFDERRERWKSDADRRRAERDRQRQEQVRRRREESQAPRETELDRQREWTNVAERQLDSRLDERRLESRIADRRHGTLGRAAAGRGHGRSPELVGPLRGLTVRDLILADVILGKPRSRRRRVRE